MDRSTVKRAKVVWAVAWPCVTAFALLGWGFPAAAGAALAFAGVSLLAFVAFFLYLLLGDTPAAPRVLLIALFLAGVLVELGALVAAVDYFAGGAVGRALGWDESF
jgi:hypothetical protein